MKKIVPFAIDDCLEHSLNILFRHTSYTDQRIDDCFLANEEEPKLIELDFCAPNAAKSIVKKETYDKVNIDSTDDLDGPSIPSSIFGASSTLRAIAGYRDRAAGARGTGGLGDTSKSKKPDGPKIIDLDPKTQPGYIEYKDNITNAELDVIRDRLDKIK